jgi:phospholipid/cholesterol/gamma-HCH transport system ATP-binding protein
MTKNPILKVEGLVKYFGDKLVHNGVSFELFENEMLGLFGGSGSGKSVVLRSLIGLEQPDAGRILFEGQDLTQLSERALFPVRQKISYVFQNGALFDSLTVEENLAYPLQAHTKLSATQIKQKVDSMLKLVDLPDTNDLLPSELSGGMQKRAGLARSIIMEPKVVLFDEPTAGLDPVNTRRLCQNILNFKARGLTGMFVTHDIASAFEICDRILILADGKIATSMTTEEMKTSKNPLVQTFTSGAHIL